jgi:DNA end-binding protein Ku
MAERLIESLSRDFDPAAYRDEYRAELLALIERKAEGKEVLTAPAPAEPAPTGTPDLMAALEESIAAAQSKRGAKAAKKRRAPAAAKKRSPPRAKAPSKSRSR